MKAIILLFCLLLSGSAFAEKAPKVQTKFLCPQGYKIQIAKSFYETGVYLPEEVITESDEIVNMICYILNDRITEWVRMRSLHPKGQGKDLWAIALKKKYKILNCMHFKCTGSYSGMCAGTLSGGVKAPLYSRYKGLTLPDYNYPLHTVQTGRDIYEMTGYRGWLEFANWYYVGALDYLPVVGHELDHAIGIDH